MHALRLGPESTPPIAHHVREPESPWAARAFDELVPPATLEEARAGRDALAVLLSRERSAAADFLLALADFDRRRGWERLGHASLFAFLTRALGLSKGAAYVRLSAARLLPAFPEVEAALRDGRLCLSAVGELARVLTRENLAKVLPRYFGCSSREAREVTAALAPRAVVPVREVVRSVEQAPHPVPLPVSAQRGEGVSPVGPTSVREGRPSSPDRSEPPPASAAVRAHEPLPTHPVRAVPPPPRDEAEPLDADLRRLHVTVSRRLLEKLDRARDGLSHALPHATTEQVLEAALDLLLERQARAHALVKRPRSAAAPASPQLAPTSADHDAPAGVDAPANRGRSGRPHIPAAVERAVRLRDGNRCQHPLDGGGVCGTSRQVELDHIVPVALGGESTVANLRCACRAHNRRAAEDALGARAGERRRRRRG